MSERGAPGPFAVLEGYRYASLLTRRKDGRTVPTPVWFAPEGETLYVFTGRHSGKVRRIRNDPRVTLAPSDWRGRVFGESAEAEARILGESPTADRALREKYGWQYRLARAFLDRLPGKHSEHVFLEIRAASDGS